MSWAIRSGSSCPDGPGTTTGWPLSSSTRLMPSENSWPAASPGTSTRTATCIGVVEPFSCSGAIVNAAPTAVSLPDASTAT